jgi:phage protein D
VPAPSSSQQSAFTTDIDVLFDGTEITDDDVISFVVERDLGQPDMAVITLRNDHHKHTKDRNPAQQVEIKAGGSQEGASKVTVFKGEIVGIEPVYKAQGDSRVVIRAFNKMHRMLRGKKSKTYQNMSDQDIVGQIVGDHGLSAESGSDPKITHEHVYQHNQTDLEFIRVRAARLGFSVWCEDTKLYFDKPKTDQDSGIELKIEEAGEHHLKAFHARVSAANVINKVTVRGWDPKKKAEIVGEAEAQNSSLGSTKASSAAGALGSAVTFTVDHPIYSVQEAQAIAKAKLGEHSMSYLTGEAECRGNGAYKPGIVVKITVNGETPDDRFNGKYLINGVTHKYTHGSASNPTGGFVSVLRVSRDAEKP